VKADPKVWSILTLKSVQDLHLLLDNFGIYVIKIPPLNDLDHNASLHLVDPKGQLIKISSLENADELFKGRLFDLRGYRLPMNEKKIRDTVKWGRNLLGLPEIKENKVEGKTE
jgi:hypothetical protein